MMALSKIISISTHDVRFPTSLTGDGSNPMHPNSDCSCAYVILHTDGVLQGHGFTFLHGRGTDLVCAAIEAYTDQLVDRRLDDIFSNLLTTWRAITGDSQLRWLGPEKGVVHLACSAIMNALWDLWAKLEEKPVWKLLVDMDPEKLVSLIEFKYLSDVITKDEAVAILKEKQAGKSIREAQLLSSGYPAYITSVGWAGHDDRTIRTRCKEALAQGWTRFKMKVGANLEDDRRRASVIREEIGWDNLLMMECKQMWEVQEAVDWMRQLAEFHPTWIEEPTSPDDVLGQAQIKQELSVLGIGVATGQHCANRVLFKQFLKADALTYCQPDACRLAGINDLLAVYLMAAKFKVPVCPHAGGVGMCELVQHLSFFDFICVSGSLQNRMTEYADHLHEHMRYPVTMGEGSYLAPQAPGYSSEMLATSLQDYSYPFGQVWRSLFEQDKFQRPSSYRGKLVMV